jgi:uncharacterized protein (TIGR04255 family)
LEVSPRVYLNLINGLISGSGKYVSRQTVHVNEKGGDFTLDFTYKKGMKGGMKVEKRSGMPLEGPPPSEIPLPRAPLVSVIAQVRFALHLPIRIPERVAVFQEAIGDYYPHLVSQNVPTVTVNVTAAGVSTQSGNEVVVHWRFSDQSHQWQVTLTPEFITLETRAYKSREDFLERFEGILKALEDTLAPKVVTRFGMRYIDQVKGEQLSEIGKLLRGEVIGVAGSLGGADARHLLTELHVPAEPGDLLARWGKLQANMTIDPNLVPPIPEDSWLLDLDVSKTQELPFDTAYLSATARSAANRVYAVFRWMVTKKFLQAYGGEI